MLLRHPESRSNSIYCILGRITTVCIETLELLPTGLFEGTQRPLLTAYPFQFILDLPKVSANYDYSQNILMGNDRLWIFMSTVLSIPNMGDVAGVLIEICNTPPRSGEASA